MKRFLLALAISLAACSANKSLSGKTVPQFHRSEVVENEFIFSGDPAVVRTYLSSKGVTWEPFEKLKENFYAVKFKGDLDLHEAMMDLVDQTQSIEANRILHQTSNMNKFEWPNDKLFFKQWGLNNIGQSAPFGIPGSRGADMDILTAHTKTMGSDKVLIAVIDSGCDYTHPDLKDGIAVNLKESPANGGQPGIDDDKNGYVDDIYGFNFVSAGLDAPVNGFPGTSDPMDDHGHGTHCTGSIVAQKDNGIGTVGVAPGARAICVKVGNAQGQVATKDAFRGIRYAIDRHVQIMTNSWGGPGTYTSSLLNSEILEAEKAGILFVVAAGNDGRNIDVAHSYPSSLKFEGRKEGKYKNVLVVGASDNQDNPAFFSNYGAEGVDVFAPGVAILSTVPNKDNIPTGTYAVFSGTSMAAPYVAGVAALLLSYTPSLKGNPEEVIRLITQSADVKESLVGKSSSNGRVNATRALEASLNKDIHQSTWVHQGFNLSQRGFNKELVDVRHEIRQPGAKQMRVHFNFVDVVSPYDSVYLYDKNYRLITEVDSTDTTDYWSPTIPGDTVYVRFVNARIQQVKSQIVIEKSEAACSTKGASEITRHAADEYACKTDTNDSSSGGSTLFNSFNSEGFSIDQIAWVSQ
jgi:thermitase